MWAVRHLVLARLRSPELSFLDNPMIGADFLSARLTGIKVIGRYLGLLVWLQTLSCDHSYKKIPLVAWCAIGIQAGQPRLNFDCLLVRRHLCSAYRGLSELYRDTNKPADERQAQAMF